MTVRSLESMTKNDLRARLDRLTRLRRTCEIAGLTIQAQNARLDIKTTVEVLNSKEAQ